MSTYCFSISKDNDIQLNRLGHNDMMEEYSRIVDRVSF